MTDADVMFREFCEKIIFLDLQKFILRRSFPDHCVFYLRLILKCYIMRFI